MGHPVGVGVRYWDPRSLLQLQIVLGALVAVLNVVLGVKLLRGWRMRRDALLTWPAPKPPYYGLTLFIGVVFGGLVLLEVFVLQRSFGFWFFDLMMLVYYGYLTPLSTRVRRGFYERGIWSDRAFVAYERIGALTWRDEGPVVLMIVSRARRAVQRLTVPQRFYGEARRLLRDRIREHQIEIAPTGLVLGTHDARDDV